MIRAEKRESRIGSAGERPALRVAMSTCCSAVVIPGIAGSSRPLRPPGPSTITPYRAGSSWSVSSIGSGASRRYTVTSSPSTSPGCSGGKRGSETAAETAERAISLRTDGSRGLIVPIHPRSGPSAFPGDAGSWSETKTPLGGGSSGNDGGSAVSPVAR